MMGFISSTLWVAEKTLKYALKEIEKELPDQLRFEVQRFKTQTTKVQPHWEFSLPKKYMWTCPDANYDWHYTVDDLGVYDTWEEANEAGEEHWRKYHQGLWPVLKECER